MQTVESVMWHIQFTQVQCYSGSSLEMAFSPKIFYYTVYSIFSAPLKWYHNYSRWIKNFGWMRWIRKLNKRELNIKWHRTYDTGVRFMPDSALLWIVLITYIWTFLRVNPVDKNSYPGPELQYFFFMWRLRKLIQYTKPVYTLKNVNK
jgi:hypothetical protein